MIQQEGSNLKLLVVSQDIPYPANHGGKVDVWNRLKALSRSRVNIDLLTWADNSVTNEQIAVIKQYVRKLHIYQQKRISFIKKLLLKRPIYAEVRALNQNEYKSLLQHYSADPPNAIFLEMLYGSLVALQLSNDLCVPLIYRSQNVEYEYIKCLRQAEKNWYKKASRWLNAYPIKKSEFEVRKNSRLIYDISEIDAMKWDKEKEMVSTRILNPFIFINCKELIESTNFAKDIDVLFVGNLHTPNNIFGINWFMDNVIPYLKGLTVVIAGSNPSPKLYSKAELYGVTLISNPPDIQPLYRRARVLINPIWHGSGVNIKMIEMLATGKPVVSTSIGLRGLASTAVAFSIKADCSGDFATAIHKHLKDDINIAQINAIYDNYNWNNVTTLIQEINSIIR